MVKQAAKKIIASKKKIGFHKLSDKAYTPPTAIRNSIRLANKQPKNFNLVEVSSSNESNSGKKKTTSIPSKKK